MFFRSLHRIHQLVLRRTMASSSSKAPRTPLSAALDNLRIRCGVFDPLDSEPNLKGTKKRKRGIKLTVNVREINVYNVTNEDIEYLDSVTEVAYFGLDKEKVIDLNVRNSRYTKVFDLNLDLEDIMKKMGVRNVFIKPYKLNLYSKGSFFATHRDSDIPGLVGNLILILPTTYTGGEIKFGDRNLESALAKDELRFIFFDAGLEHSISEVLSGHRITLVYNVFNRDSCSSLLKSDIRFIDVPEDIYKEISSEAIKFCKDKKNVLFGQCKYRNDLFYKLVEDLKQKYEVIDVVVDRENEDISKVRKAYIVMDEEEYSYQCREMNVRKLKDMATDIYAVNHVLFPSVSSLDERSVKASREVGGYVGNEPEYEREDFNIECYAAFLVNPDAPTRPSEEHSSSEEHSNSEDE